MKSMNATIRMLEEAIDTERQLRRQTRLDAEEEATGPGSGPPTRCLMPLAVSERPATT
jgi:hypothetical protein